MEEERIDKILLERGLVSTRVRAEEIIKKYGFKPWGWYRIIAGILLLAYFNLYK